MTSRASRSRQLWRQFIDMMFPGTCYLCAGSAQGLLCPPCQEEALASYGPSRCSICALPLAGDKPLEAPLCPECLKSAPSYTRVLCGALFIDPHDRLLRQFKNHYAFEWLETLCGPLIEEINHQPDDLPDALVPMPLHWRKRLRRGYNQSEIVARHLARHCQLPLRGCLKKVKATAPQHNLTRRERMHNLSGSLRCEEDLSGFYLVIVDDVVTTGSSAECAAQCLLDAGAARVDIWALARTPKPV